MALTVIKTVKPSGGDYTSLAAWEAGEQRDLVTLNEVAVAECYAMTDTAWVTVSGWTTDSAHYIRIYTPISERHAGTWDAAKYNISPPTNGHGIYVSGVSHVRIEGIQVRPVASYVTSRYGFFFSGSQVSEFIIDSCIARGDLSIISTGSGYGIYIAHVGGATSNVLKASNCLCYDFISTGTEGVGFFDGENFNSSYFYNCTADNCISGFSGTSFSVWKNCGASNCTTPFVSGTQTTCSSTTPIYVDAANDDFHLASGDTTWKDAGTDLSTDADYPISTGINGETRSGTWDIGADEYVAAGGGATVISGVTAGLSAYLGTAIRGRSLSGAAAFISGATGLAGHSVTAKGTTAGLSFLSGSLGMVRDRSGGLSIFSGAITASALTGLTGSINVFFAMNGGADLTRFVSGPITAISSLSGGAGVLKTMQDAMSGVSMLTASITGQPANYIFGNINTLPTFIGGVAMVYGLGVSSLSASLLTGDIPKTLFCGGLVSGTSFVTDFPVFSWKLSPNTLRGSPRFDITRYVGGASLLVQADLATATVTQDNNNPKVTR